LKEVYLFWFKSEQLEKNKIKYSFEGHEIRNNVPYRNFSRFRMKFELKFKKAI
jgi:hypothetical protein